MRAGLKAIYVSGWQCAADANLSGHMYPDQSLYPANSVPMLVERLNRALLRADIGDVGRFTERESSVFVNVTGKCSRNMRGVAMAL